MDVLIRLYNMVNPAADGSIISREVTEEYLQSEDYKTIIRDKIALGGKTHKDRTVGDEYRSSIGPDDEVLVRRNSLFYIKKIFTKPDSDFCWAIISIFNPDNFSGELRDEIVNLRGLLKEGTKLPCSVVIQAVWAADNRCLKIIRIKGVDFTMNPSFTGSGTEKLMSVHVISDVNETKMFSEVEGVKRGTRLFSFQTEVEKDEQVFGELLEEYKKKIRGEVNDKVFTKREILLKYGRGSKEYKAFAMNQNVIDNNIMTKERLAECVAALQGANDSISQEEFLTYLDDYVTPENKELFLQINRENTGKVQQLVNAVPKDDPNYKELIQTRLVNYFKGLPQSDKLFSLGSIIQDKMRLMSYNRLIRFRFFVRLYKNYFLENQQTLTPEQRNSLEESFISDAQLLLKDALEYMKQGLNLSVYYQLGTYSPDLSRTARILSFYYRRLLISEDILGYIPPKIYQLWNQSMIDFLNNLIIFVFGSRIGMTNLSVIK